MHGPPERPCTDAGLGSRSSPRVEGPGCAPVKGRAGAGRAARRSSSRGWAQGCGHRSRACREPASSAALRAARGPPARRVQGGQTICMRGRLPGDACGGLGCDPCSPGVARRTLGPLRGCACGPGSGPEGPLTGRSPMGGRCSDRCWRVRGVGRASPAAGTWSAGGGGLSGGPTTSCSRTRCSPGRAPRGRGR